MSKFEVQEWCLCGGWTNTWHEYDDDNNEVPMLFDSQKDAELELKIYLLDMEKAFIRGDIATPEDNTYFRIMEVSK